MHVCVHPPPDRPPRRPGGAVKSDIFSFGTVNSNTIQRPFWAAALLRRKFGAAIGGGELRRANSFRPSIEIPKGGAALLAAEPKKKDIC